MDAEVFAVLCLVEAVDPPNGMGRSWTTGSDTGSDPDD